MTWSQWVKLKWHLKWWWRRWGPQTYYSFTWCINEKNLTALIFLEHFINCIVNILWVDEKWSNVVWIGRLHKTNGVSYKVTILIINNFTQENYRYCFQLFYGNVAKTLVPFAYSPFSWEWFMIREKSSLRSVYYYDRQFLYETLLKHIINTKTNHELLLYRPMVSFIYLLYLFIIFYIIHGIKELIHKSINTIRLLVITIHASYKTL